MEVGLWDLPSASPEDAKKWIVLILVLMEVGLWEYYDNNN